MNKDSATLSLYVRLIRALDTALSVEEIFDAVSELTCQIIPANRSSITTFLRDEKTLEARSIHDDRTHASTRLELGFKVTLNGNPADYIELALKPKIWSPADKLHNHPAQDLNELGMLSIMNVPLLSDQQFIGTLNLGSRLRIFQPDDLIEFRQIAALVSVSLDRFADLTRVKATSRRHLLYAQQLECLNNLSEHLLQVTTLEQVLEKTKHCVNQLVGARRVSYCTLEPDGQSIRIKALVGESTDHAGQLVPLEDSGLSESLVRGKTQYVSDLMLAPNKAHRSLGRSGLAHLWAFPIKHGQAVMGALIIATEKTELASEEATAILGTLARLLEATLERIHIQTYADNVTPYDRRINHNDALTSLLDHDDFRLQLEYWIKRCESSDSGFGLMLIDLDRIGELNQKSGHTSDEHVLRSFSKRLSKVLRSTDIIAHSASNTFLVLLPMIDRVAHLGSTTTRALEALSQPIELKSSSIRVKVSIGYCLYPENGNTPSSLIQSADIAMYQAKSSGGNTSRCFNAGLPKHFSTTMKLAQQLTKAANNNEFSLMFQPIVNATSKRVISIEALLRWHHPDGGVILPSTFIPLAESSNTMPVITDWVLESGLKTIKALQQDYPGIRVSINLSAADIADKHSLYQRVESALKRTDANPESLELEFTETILLKHPEESDILVKKLRKLGVRIALDNFGIGHTALSFLVSLPINSIKIDHSLIEHINRDTRRQAVITGILAISGDLDLNCVAEGVETHDQQQWLEAAGCHYQQGQLISSPVDERSLPGCLRQIQAQAIASV